MPAINLPFNPQVGDPLDPSQVMGNFTSITGVVNGALEADSNIQVAAPNSQPGTANNEGVATTLLRSDATFVVQGVENLAADPTTGNVLGRVYWNTVVLEMRVCTSVSGTGMYAPLNPSATELVIHAAQHKDGGHDPLADNTLTDHMKAARTIYTATLGADVTTISTTTYTTILDLSVTTTNAQTLWVSISVALDASAAGANRIFWLRMLDRHNATGDTNTDTTIWRSEQTTVLNGSSAGTGTPPNGFFYTASFPYTTPAIGLTRTLRLQASVDVASNAAILKPTTHRSDSTTINNLTAVIV